MQLTTGGPSENMPQLKRKTQQLTLSVSTTKETSAKKKIRIPINGLVHMDICTYICSIYYTIDRA